jgi:hypothetical protein
MTQLTPEMIAALRKIAANKGKDFDAPEDFAYNGVLVHWSGAPLYTYSVKYKIANNQWRCHSEDYIMLMKAWIDKNVDMIRRYK